MKVRLPRAGRFLSVDRITKKYPELTPYQFASNRPIDGIDQDGLEHIYNLQARQAKERANLQIKMAYDLRHQNASFTIKDEFVTKLNWNHPNQQYLTFDRYDIHQTLTIDLTKAGSDAMYQYTYDLKLHDNIEAKDLVGEKLDKWLSPGSEAGTTKYGYQIYGKGKDMEWNNSIPKAMSGSESLNLGDWLDYVGGLREGASISDLFKEGRAKNIVEGYEKFKDAWEKSKAFKEALDGGSNGTTPRIEPGGNSSVMPRIEPGGSKAKKRTVIMTVDRIPGVSPDFQGPWEHRNPEGVNDTIFKKKKD